MALPGKSAVVSDSVVAGGAGAYNPIAELNNFSMREGASNIDISEFGDTFINRIQGMKDCTWTASGFWSPGDTNGQVAVRNAWLNDTELWIRVWPNGAAGFKQQVRVSRFEIGAGVDGPVTVSMEFEGTGAVAAA